LSGFYDKVYKEFSLFDNPDEWGLYLDLNRKNPLAKSRTKTVDSIFKHGDLIYLLKSGNACITQASSEPVHIEEDEVDRILSKKDGRIQRDRDEQL
jgi:hypothetical protein